MKKTFLFLPALLLLFSNCAPTLELQSLEVTPTVSVERLKQISVDSTYSLIGKKYSLPILIEEVQYQPQWEQMAINFLSERRKPAYAILDLKKEALNWANKGRYNLSMLRQDITLVNYESKSILVESENGMPIRWVNGEEIAVIDDSITLKMGERFSSVDLRTGNTQWSRIGESRYEGWMSDELDGDWMYVIANGLHGFNLNTGKGFYHQAKTNYDASRGGRALANGLMLGLNILSTVYGGYPDAFPYFESLRAHNIHAKPKFAENDLYFADRKAIYCLNKQSGELYWEHTMETELGISEIELLSDQDLLVIGKGYRYVNYALDKDKNAVLLLMDTNNGDLLAEKALPKREIIINHALNDAYIYLLTEGGILQYDYQLDLVKNLDLPSVYGAPLRVVTWSSSRYDADLKTSIPDFPLVIRTMQGVVALHPVTLEELWYERLGIVSQEMPPVLSEDRWQLPILMQDLEKRRSWVDEQTETFWFAKAGQLIGLNLINQGYRVAEFEMDSDDFWFVGRGHLLQYGGRDIRVLNLRSN